MAERKRAPSSLKHGKRLLPAYLLKCSLYHTVTEHPCPFISFTYACENGPSHKRGTDSEQAFRKKLIVLQRALQLVT